MEDIIYVTSNHGNVKILQVIFRQITESMELETTQRIQQSSPENYLTIATPRLEPVVKTFCNDAQSQLNACVVVSLCGLFLNHGDFKGFPASYSKYVESRIGTKGLLDLLRDYQSKKDRYATLKCVVGYKDYDMEDVKLFQDQVSGYIDYESRSEGINKIIFGEIFIPTGSSDAIGTMPEKKLWIYCPKIKALGKFAKWFINKKMVK